MGNLPAGLKPAERYHCVPSRTHVVRRSWAAEGRSEMSQPTRSTSREGLRGHLASVERRALVALRRRIAPGYGVRADHELANVRIPADVVAYFADPPAKLYQIDQWLPVFERLHRHRPVLIVCRNVRTLRELRRRTTIPLIFVRTFASLMDLYERGGYRVVLYVNNAAANFQSLAATRVAHVHINHGESDKASMVSNQAKAYDRLFVAGDAAVARHADALLSFDLNRLVKIGRPQLDVMPPASLPASPLRTLLYAPTWGGEAEANNYSSVDRHGVAIITAMLAVPSSRVVYHPHPRIPTGNGTVRAAHLRILGLLERARVQQPEAGHRYSLGGSILGLFPSCDLMVTDISAVGLDFVYLRTDAPLFLTDRCDDRDRRAAGAPVALGADIVDSSTLPYLATTLAQRLVEDVLAEQRQQVRRHYFGDLAPGESTRRFFEEIDAVITEQSKLLTRREAGRDRGRPLPDQPALPATDWVGSAGWDRLTGRRSRRGLVRKPAPHDRCMVT